MFFQDSLIKCEFALLFIITAYIFPQAFIWHLAQSLKRHVLLTTKLNTGFASVGGPGHFTQIKNELLYTQSL